MCSACQYARSRRAAQLGHPLHRLAAEARDLLGSLIAQASRQGATGLLSSHELDRAESLADRVVDLVGGTTVPAAAPAPAPAATAPPAPAPPAPDRDDREAHRVA